MKHIKPIITLLLAVVALSATAALPADKIPFPGGKCWLYRVYLTDKHGTPYSTLQPEKYLSAKAIERRARQHLAIDSTDLPLSPVYTKALRRNRFQIVSHSKWNNTLLIRLTDTLQAARLKSFPFVKAIRQVFVAPDSVISKSRLDLEADTLTPKPSIYGYGRQQIQSLDGARLHEAGFRGKGMTIAVIDGGFMNADKIELMRNINVVGARNFTYPPTTSVYDELDHGTCVLSTIGANVPNRLVGTAPEASFWLLRSEYGPTESEAEEDSWAAAVEYADSVGVDVINSSLGYHDFDGGGTSHTYRQLDGQTALISRTASLLASKGIVLTNSAGNDGANSWKKISCPADARDILTVGAMRRDSVNTTFSSIGYSADGRVKPDVMAVGYKTTLIRGNGMIAQANGTSFSSPVTCGLVACLWQALPKLTAKQIIALVRESADRYECPDNIFGYGIPDFWKAYQNGLKLQEGQEGSK